MTEHNHDILTPAKFHHDCAACLDEAIDIASVAPHPRHRTGLEALAAKRRAKRKP